MKHVVKVAVIGNRKQIAATWWSPTFWRGRVIETVDPYGHSRLLALALLLPLANVITQKTNKISRSKSLRSILPLLWSVACVGCILYTLLTHSVALLLQLNAVLMKWFLGCSFPGKHTDPSGLFLSRLLLLLGSLIQKIGCCVYQGNYSSQSAGSAQTFCGLVRKRSNSLGENNFLALYSTVLER